MARTRCSNAEVPTLRTFLAVDLDRELLDAAHSRTPVLAAHSKVRWVAREAMHVTIRFFGETTDAQLAPLRTLVADLGAAVHLPIAVRVGPLVGFPGPERARVLVLELDDPARRFASFASAAEQVAVALGFPAENRAYRPHLTLARVREPVDLTALRHEEDALPSGIATALTLYASATGSAGPIYTPLERVLLPTR